jgi:glycosyltransferase 2 family protein
MLLTSAALYLAAFVVLIETWRRIVIAWGDTISFSNASAIWLISSLARYLPYNFVFQIGAIAELSRRRRISPAAATGASLINVAVNVASGFIIALVAGYGVLDRMSYGHAKLGIAAAVVLLVGTLALPLLLPRMLGILRAITGRELVLGELPVRAIYLSLAGNLVAWVLYGLSYRALVAGVIGIAAGPVTTYIAVWAGAYVVGYLAFLIPAGAGVREFVQMGALPALGLATGPQAATIAVCMRVLSMILEIVPGLLFLSRGTRPRHQE